LPCYPQDAERLQSSHSFLICFTGLTSSALLVRAGVVAAADRWLRNPLPCARRRLPHGQGCCLAATPQAPLAQALAHQWLQGCLIPAAQGAGFSKFRLRSDATAEAAAPA